MNDRASTPRQAAMIVVATLRRAGYQAYLAGGCVRDAMLGFAPKDYDVATDATPDQVQRLLPRTAAVGAAFGVVLVYIPNAAGEGRFTIEVATFRAEGAYSDGRRPDSVRFTTAEEDARRRDFTINGLFADPPADDAPPGTPDTILDYVGGRADLEAGVLRAIGDPSERFGEDYLRMLRAVRFAARLGFEIEPRTRNALRVNARYLSQISRERIGQELLAMLTGPRPALAIDLAQQLKLDGPMLNEDPAEHELAATRRLSTDAGVPARLAAWLIDRHGRGPATARVVDRWRQALSLSNDDRDELLRLLNLLDTLDGWRQMPPAQRKRTAALPSWPQALLLVEAVGGDAASLANDAQQLAGDGIGLTPDPLVGGEDLIAMGLAPGPRFKTLLDSVYDAQLEGRVATRSQALNHVRELTAGDAP